MAAGRPRLLQVATTFPPYIGGVETHTHEVVKRLAPEWDITVLTTDPSRELPSVEERSDGVTIVRVPAYPRGGDLFLAPRLPRVIARGRWDLIHCQGYHTLVPPLAMLTAAIAGTPYLVSLHSGGHASPIRRLIRWPQRLILRPLLSRARRIIAVSRFERDTFAASMGFSRRRFEIIPNGADLPAPRRDSRTDGRPVIVTVGRLERYKGHHRMVGAMPFVLRERPDATLVIAGRGPEADSLLAQAETLGVGERVSIRPVEPGDRQAMADLLGSADVVGVLSEYESHGLAAIEAAALGRPLVVSNTTALRDLVQRGEARGVALDAPHEAVAAALLNEAAAAPRAHGVAPTWDECASALARCYRGILGSAA
jgi:glycosyltransferase involved in cell wall biosynthesis